MQGVAGAEHSDRFHGSGQKLRLIGRSFDIGLLELSGAPFISIPKAFQCIVESAGAQFVLLYLPLAVTRPKQVIFFLVRTVKSIEVGYAQSIQLLFLKEFHQGDPAVLFKIPKGMVEIEEEMGIAHFLNLRRKGMRLFTMR